MGSLLIYPDRFEKVEGAGDLKVLFPGGFEYADICEGQGVTIGAYFPELPEGNINYLLIELFGAIWPEMTVPRIRGRVLINAADAEGKDIPLDEKTLASMSGIMEQILARKAKK